MEQIKVLLVDDHHIVRHGLKLLFLSDKAIDVVGEAGSGVEAMEYLGENENIDVVISDVTMDNMDGIELTKRVTEKFDTNVMMLTMHLDEKYITEAMSSGAKGYLGKDSNEKDIIEAVKAVNRGEIFLTRTVSDILAKSLLKTSENKDVEERLNLTRREKQILGYIVEGLNNRRVGEELNISERTVNAHRYNMMKKLKANNTADLVRIALRFDLVS